jgi:hypothetical protein
MVLVGVIGVVIVLLIVGLLSGGGSGSRKPAGDRGSRASSKHRSRAHARSHEHHLAAGAAPHSAFVALSLRATARVYVCLIGDDGRRLIPGSELEAGASTPIFHAKHFEITLGNSAVTMFVDGTQRTVPPSSEPIGYSITKALGRRRLPPGGLPTCT